MGTQKRKHPAPAKPGRRTQQKKQRRQRLKIHEITAENDIRFRGPLNYQHFQILGWLCIVMSQAVVALSAGAKVDPEFAVRTGTLVDILTTLSSLSLPFLLIANFARILNNTEGYLKQLLTNGTAMLGIAGLSILVLYRYIIDSLQIIEGSAAASGTAAADMIQSIFKYGFVSFNIFVDLFLCTLVMFFLNYRPRRLFRGKSLIVFRLFTLFPIAYELVSIWLKIRSSLGLVELPLWSCAFLTVKPPMTFVLFVILAVYVKTRELRFRRHGKTHQDYLAFLKTRKNSWNFSAFLAVMMAVISLLDFIVYMGTFMWYTGKNLQGTLHQMQQEIGQVDEAQFEETRQKLEDMLWRDVGPEPEEAPDAKPSENPEDEVLRTIVDSGMMDSLNATLAIGFGKSVVLILLAPLVLLFSYTKIPKNPQFSTFIPMAGIALIFLVYLEIAHQLLKSLPLMREFLTTEPLLPPEITDTAGPPQLTQIPPS